MKLSIAARYKLVDSCPYIGDGKAREGISVKKNPIAFLLTT
jgi:hypothetical protein